MALTPEQAARQWKQLVAAIKAVRNKAEITALADIQGAMLQRIHNRGQNVAGAKIGQYNSAKWREQRKLKGLQTAYVDAQYSGTLLRETIIGKAGPDNVLGFQTDAARNKARNITRLKGGPIWQATEKEARDAAEAFAAVLTETIQKNL